VVLGGLLAAPADAATAPPAAHRAGVVLVGFEPGLSAAERHGIESTPGSARGSRTLVSGPRFAAAGRSMRGIGPLTRLRVKPGSERRVVRRLRATAGVRFAELDYVMAQDAVPDDPGFGLQWGFQNIGQTVNGTTGAAGADENAVAAWDDETGSRTVVVGVVDSGVDYNHPDLAANVWTNPGGVGGCPAGTHGRNVVAGSCDPMDDETVFGGHGTHVAGIAGAVGDNGIGVTGVNWQSTILPVKWLNANGSGSTSQLIAALDWLLTAQASGVNVRVINDSATFLGTAYSQALSDEIDLLGAHNILFVTAAGNTGDDNDDPSVRRYPCGYDRPTEICVTASNQSDQLPTWANYGANTVDLAAPGVNVYSTLRGGTYGYVSGGSMAAPQVAGTAALILAAGDRPVDSLRARILGNVDLLPSLAGLVHTGGRLDVCAALPGCQPSISIDSGPPRYTNSTTSTFNFSSDDPEAWIRCRLATEPRFQTCGSTKTYAAQSAGTYTLRVYAIDPAGHRSAVKSQTWTVDPTPPVASIDSGPSGTTAQTAATFGFSAVDADPKVRFRCRLDGEPAAGCVSPTTYAGLADGRHRFVVRAIDRAGNTSSPAVRNWVVDTPARQVGGFSAY
jgi:subtilisin family serine protease